MSLSYDFGHPTDIHGIERQVLCKNVLHEGEADDIRTEQVKAPFEEIEDVEFDSRKMNNSFLSMDSHTRGAAPDPALCSQQPGGYSSGPKAVLEDYHHAQVQRQIKLERDKLRRKNYIECAALGSTQSTSFSASGKQREIKVLQDIDQASEQESISDDSAEDDDCDASFMANFRAKRMEQLRLQQKRAQLQCKDRTTYGNVVNVSADKFLNLLEEDSPPRFILVHIYETFVAECVSVDRWLLRLAKEHPRILILRLKGSETTAAFDHIICPAINVYRDGILGTSLVRVMDHMGASSSFNDFYEYLQMHVPVLR